MGTLLERFVTDLRDLTTGGDVPDDAELAATTGELLQDLVQRPGLIPEEYTRLAADARGRGYILHRAPTFAVSAVIWRPGDAVPPHSHETWGAVGVVSNGIEERRYELAETDTLDPRDHFRHRPGDVSLLVPDDDIHSMHNVSDHPTVEVHVYGKDISRMVRRGWSYDGRGLHDIPVGKYLNC